jgi:alpha-tubulin suppressor-like RCC1 family protein
MSTNFNTCFIDSNGADVSQEFIEKSYLLDVYSNLIDAAKAPSLWAWGTNPDGELGISIDTDRSSPVQTVSGGTNWKQVAAGASHSAAIKTDGTLWSWGWNLYGQLGTNGTASRSSPVQTVSGGTNWKQVSAGGMISAAIKTDGTLWLWGAGNYGQLGTNSIISASSPVQTVSGGTNWKQVSVGWADTTAHVGAIKTDGSLWLWGMSDSGRLGTNNTTRRSSPVQTVSGGTNWKQISIGHAHTAAIKTDGTLWLWGDGAAGGLGDNTAASKSSPVQTVAGGSSWKQVSTGCVHSAAIKTDGTLWVWGDNGSGQLGTNNTTDRSSPVQTLSGGTNWKQISIGFRFSSAIKTDGSLWLWGSGTTGQLGQNSVTSRSSPVQIISCGNNWKQVSVGCHALAIREEGDW